MSSWTQRSVAMVFGGGVMVCAMAGQAVAQDAFEGAPAVRLPAAAGDAEADWTLATGLLQQAQYREAQTAFSAFAQAYPDDPRARYARSLAGALREMIAMPDREVAVVSQAGRIEVVVFSTLWGIGTGALLGVELAEAMDSGDGKVPLWTAIAGGGLGLGLSLWLTGDRPPTAGQASLISSAGVWGYGLGFELALGTPLGERCETDFDLVSCGTNDHALRLLPVAVSTLGIAGAVVYGHYFPEVTTGDVALVNTAGLWTTATALELLLLLDLNTAHVPFDAALVGSLVGLGGGAYLASQFEVSRARMNLINLAGLLGVGLGAAIAATAELDSSQGWGGVLIGSQVAGLTTGILLTRNRTPRGAEPSAALQLSPMFAQDHRGTTRGLSLHAAW